MSVERLAPAVRELVRAEIAAAHGREVSFVARPDANGVLVQARPVARGTVDAVLALPGEGSCCCTTTRAACSSPRVPT